ncbi:hypothetical protein TNCV_3236611 [Trichonephila clavipes]|nr:hypothetical protein TNCV_3236611 [Trichonephila clavipes]
MCFDTFHPSWNRLMPSPSTFLPLWCLWRYSRNSMRWNMQLDRAKSELASSTKRQRETKNIARNTEKNVVFTAERYSVFAEEAIQFNVNGRDILMEEKNERREV